MSWSACNKRQPGSGCAAVDAYNRNHAVLGVDDSCIAQYPGDFGVALIALDAQVELAGADRQRIIPFAALHRPASGKPHIETTLRPGEVITAFRVPAGGYTRRSLPGRSAIVPNEPALASAAVALSLDGDVVREARIGVGGMAYRPWRSSEAETAMAGKPLSNDALAGRAAPTHRPLRRRHHSSRQRVQAGARPPHAGAGADAGQGDGGLRA